MWLLLRVFLCASPACAEYPSELGLNPYAPDSTANPSGTGSAFKPDGINNPYSPCGSPFTNQSATNPFATEAPRLYDQQGHYRGKLAGASTSRRLRSGGLNGQAQETQVADPRRFEKVSAKHVPNLDVSARRSV